MVDVKRHWASERLTPSGDLGPNFFTREYLKDGKPKDSHYAVNILKFSKTRHFSKNRVSLKTYLVSSSLFMRGP